MKWFYNIVIYGMIFNVALYLIQICHLTPVFLEPNYSLTSIGSIFNLDVFSLQFTGANLIALAGGAALMLVSLLTRQNTYALYALIIWAVGVLIKPVQDFIWAIPNAINNLIGKTPFNPMWDGKATYTGGDPYSIVFSVLFTIAAWFFLMEVILQRPLTN